MAIDEALLRNFNPDTSLPVLRVYGWTPAALSLGRFQQVTETLDLKFCRESMLPIVRRITGGGALFHADELTYSIVCSSAQIPPATSVKESFRVLTGFLLEFYRRLNLSVSYAIDSSADNLRLGERTAFCFAGHESFDILTTGKKIGGNAQRRVRNRIFQHGSIPIENRSNMGLRYMKDKSPSQSRDTTSLRDSRVTDKIESLQNHLLAAFRTHFMVALEQDELNGAELESMQLLLQSKYLCDSWNMEGIESC